MDQDRERVEKKMLRKLMEKDTEYMKEWMSDKSITNNFQIDFSVYTEEKIKSFIEKERACGANELANAILRNAIGENEGNENDDMTVITLKIRQRRELLHVA